MEMKNILSTTSLLPLLLCFEALSQAIESPAESFDLAGQRALAGGSTGSSPWSSAAASFDSSGFDASFSYVNLVGQTINPGDFRLIGGGLRFGRKSLSICTALGMFDALDVWREAFVHLSCGLFTGSSFGKRRIAISAGLDGSEFGIVGEPSMRDHACRVNLAGYLHGIYLMTGFDVDAPILQNTDAEPSRLSRARASFHIESRESSFGSPGFTMGIRDFESPEFSLSLGEYFRFGKYLAFEASLGMNPASLGLGLFFYGSHVSSQVSGRMISQLGWGYSIGEDWRR